MKLINFVVRWIWRLVLVAVLFFNLRLYAPFPPNLPPGHGMFYSAWKAHLLAGVVILQNGAVQKDKSELAKHCDVLAEALKSADTPFLASYQGRAWPCDSIPAIHAMRILDQVKPLDCLGIRTIKSNMPVAFCQSGTSWLRILKMPGLGLD